jgi:hypothetical protein
MLTERMIERPPDPLAEQPQAVTLSQCRPALLQPMHPLLLLTIAIVCWGMLGTTLYTVIQIITNV